MTILCLHGSYGSASVQLAPFIDAMEKSSRVKFRWIDGSHRAVPPPGFENYFGQPPLYRFVAFDGVEALDDVLSRIRELPQGITPEDTIRSLVKEQQPYSPRTLQSALDRLFQIMDEDREIDGILGYSEGATVAATLILEESRRLQEEGRPRRIKYGIFFAGWPPVRLQGDHIQVLLPDEVENAIDVPTCHVIGCNDPYIHGAMALYSMCDEDTALLFDHGKGHTVPRDARTIRELAEAVDTTQQRCAAYNYHLTLYVETTQEATRLSPLVALNQCFTLRISAHSSPPIALASKRQRRILLLTNVDRGEANIFLATCHALLHRDPDIELHFATLKGLEESITSIKGLSMADGLRHFFANRKSEIPLEDDYLPKSFLKPLRLSSTKRAIHDSIPIFVPYEGPQLAEIFSSIVDIIKKVEADLVVVDMLMTAALTACYHLGIKFICLSPNAIKEFAAPLVLMTKHMTPILRHMKIHGDVLHGSLRYLQSLLGFPYPVLWYLIPLNILFALYMVHTYMNDTHWRDVRTYLAENTGATLRTPVDLLRNRPADLKILVSTLPELDFPSILPSHVFPCGPILRNSTPISEADPSLAAWLSRGPTVYVNLGSICRIAEDRAVELAAGLKIAFEAAAGAPGFHKLQVLWKLKKLGKYDTAAGSRIYEVLGREIENDRVRIVDWVEAEPIAILQSGHVMCSIHHGGANSYNEAIVAGVPHVILPQWTDCYDYAQRVELLGIGRLGNRTTKPQWSLKELSRELREVLLGRSSETMRQKAKDLANVCRARGNGAENAARIILHECEGNTPEVPLSLGL
ncbi:hypothetical protein DL771_009229 [Monosporascus sp. 5C6A]|nr:hypothetical protein DL771_009229 [Monosporascus sp. 5C6A]